MVHSPPEPAAANAGGASLMAIRLIAILATIIAISACGGGGDDGLPDAATPSVDCKAHPELCK